MSRISTLSDIETIEQVSLDEYDLPSSTYEMLQRGAAIGGDRLALSFFMQGTSYDKPVELTHRELLGRINQTANMFYDLGIGPRDVVSMVLPNLPQAFLTIWGAEATGIVNPINPLLESAQIVEIMRATGTKVLVTLAPFPKTDIWEKVDLVRREVPTLKTILQVDPCQFLTGIKKFIACFLSRRGGDRQAKDATLLRRKRVGKRLMDGESDPALLARLSGEQEILDFDEMVGDYPSDNLVSKREIKPGDIASYFHTGGTTGAPKIAEHTHMNEVFDAWAASQNITIGPGKVMFCGLPLFHVNAVVVTGLIPWGNGAAVVLGTPRGYRDEGVIKNFWKIVDKYHVNFFSGVPALFSALMDVPTRGSDISSLEFALCGAAPMPVDLFRRFEEKMNVSILEGYGLTEAACISSVNPPYGERRVGSIGFRLPHQQMKAVLVDEECKYQRDCEPEEIGLVVVRGPNVFPGYLESAQDYEAWIDDGDGKGAWLSTGDLGRVDSNGYFWLTGRQKELILRGGHNIDPLLIEAPLHGHPAVALAAAVGRPHPRIGEQPVVYVQLKPGAKVSEQDLLAFSTQHADERAAVPKDVRIVGELPQTAVGKVFKPQLSWWEIEDVFARDVQALEGVAQVTVKAGPHNTHGTIAEVDVEAAPGADSSTLTKQIGEVLGRYAVHYEVRLS